MIDYIKLVKKILLIKEVYLSQNKSFEAFGLTFDPVIRNGIVRKYISFYKGLRLTIIGQELIIQNSICKFYHGYNHLDLSFMELLRAKSELEEVLGICLDDALVKSFEYGVVINVAKPALTYNSLGMYKNLKPQEMTYSGSVYGVKYVNTTHKIKIYDKTKEATRNGLKLDYGFLRIEKVVNSRFLNKSKRFKDNPIVTFANLCRRNTIQLLIDDLIFSLTQIEPNDISYHSNDLSLMDLRLLGYMGNYPVRYLIKEFHSESYKKDYIRYKQILSDRLNSNHNAFVQKVYDAGVRLMIN